MPKAHIEPKGISSAKHISKIPKVFISTVFRGDIFAKAKEIGYRFYFSEG